MENPVEGKIEKIRSWNIASAIKDGVKAYGIEHDKIPLKFSYRIRELGNEYARLPFTFSEGDKDLWTQAARRNPAKEKELIRKEIFEFIVGKIGLESSDLNLIELENLLGEIMDDEDIKQEARK